MDVSMSLRLVYCACDYLAHIFALAGWMDDEKQSPEFFAWDEQWSAVERPVLFWVRNERREVLKMLHLSWESGEHLRIITNQHLDDRGYRWGARWAAAAQSFAVRAPAFPENTWLYFVYATWQQHCLQAFDTLFHQPPLRDSPWYPRYQAQAAQIHRLMVLRRAEQPRLADLPAAARAAVAQVQADLDDLATTFAQEWRAAVESAAEQVPWTQLEPAPEQPDGTVLPPDDDDAIPW